MYYDIESDMFMLVDKIYRELFESDEIVTISSKTWEKTQWTRFEKYYKPWQVYWLIRTTVRWRIIDIVTKRSKEYENYIIGEQERIDHNVDFNKFNMEMLSTMILTEMINMTDLDKSIFVYIFIQKKTLKETKKVLLEQWFNVSLYRIRKSSNEILVKLKEKVKDMNIDEFI